MPTEHRSDWRPACGWTSACPRCTDEEPASAERFCGEIDVNETQLTVARPEYSDDIEPLLDLYRSIGDLAPLSIETEWDQLTAAYETASTVVPGDVGVRTDRTRRRSSRPRSRPPRSTAG